MQSDLPRYGNRGFARRNCVAIDRVFSGVRRFVTLAPHYNVEHIERCLDWETELEETDEEAADKHVCIEVTRANDRDVVNVTAGFLVV